ncbi:XRE family transcriptional regulator [Levilactobacillus senmaizukei DSM 21775 = NBRC 103853]|uniref:XRE family transcriptional regulator n=1 Tax=Levilactobacillus senmaizukei DSM 21775 = NBRC 103853 TaxID=1423803 RepID=A0A0R2DDC9_9LACO|nr:RodZ domain-containing protein [Levilactobacillus senmaizukei]KRN01906.1 XRE family transcriptional regulator [Levilactobacillus senmaizukei DSM 21775 = NBRC 103853]
MSDNSKITLGKTLRDARIAKGFTLDDLQQSTKIQKRYLIAIEDQNFDELPGDFYVRAFIKQYADMVDLDGAELLKQFDSTLPSTQTQEYVDKVNENNPETRSQQRKVDDRYVKLRRTIPIIGIVVVVLVVLIGIWVAASRSGHSTTKNNVDSSSVSVSGSSNKKSSSSSKSSSKKSSSKKTSVAKFKQLSTTANGSTWEMKHASSKPKISLSATGSAWTSVTIAGSTVWQGTLSSSTSHSLTVPSSATSVTFNFGNAPVTSVKVDGKKFKFNSATSASAASTTSSSTTTGTTTATSSSTTTSSQVQEVTLEFK